MRRQQAGIVGWVVLAVLFAGGIVAAQPESGDGVVRFQHVDATATEVYIAGDWNGWSPTATPMDPQGNGLWVADVFLDAGRYEYRLLVDGEWLADPGNPETSGSGNSVVRVGNKGTVLPAEVVAASGSPDEDDAPIVHWGLRYLGYVTSRRQEAGDRYELERPRQLVDVSVRADPTSELDVWVLMKLDSLSSGSIDRLDLRFDRSQVRWHSGDWDLRLIDNTQAFDFDDPATLLGRIGIYQDPYGYQRRGVYLQRRIAGAPLQFVYSDNTEPLALDDSLRLEPTWDVQPYAAVDTRRNGDTIAFRFRGGRADAGLGVSLRHDRGNFPGRIAELSRGTDSLGAVADARLYETTEIWNAWGVDLSMKVAALRLRAAYLSGTRDARAHATLQALGIRPDSIAVDPQLGPVTVSEQSFDLSRSRRVVLGVDAGDEDGGGWNPRLGYEYDEHHQGALVTGQPFLMRRHAVTLHLEPAWSRLQVAFDFEQEWFRYPPGSTWQTQFWFRRHNPWLDEDIADLPRFPLLGEETASTAKLLLEASLWPARNISGSLRLHVATPGWNQAPRSLESVLRLTVPLSADLTLRTHSRLATYRRFETMDPDVVTVLGPGPHFEAGSLASGSYADVSHDYRNLLSNFIEIVYTISSRSDIALGFGVDPWRLYTVRNEYMDIGWQEFVFDAGAGPRQAFTQPDQLGALLEEAESRLESERRLTLEARLRF